MSIDVGGIMDGSGGLVIPVFVPQGAGAIETLEGIAKAVEKTGQETEKAGARSETASKSWNANLKDLAEWYTYVAGAATDFGRRVTEAAEHVLDSAAQADRLQHAQEGLGVSFESAARQAGGYVNELEVMNVTQGLAQRDLRLTQTEVNALARVASDYARGSGRDFRGVVEQLSEAVAKGGEELGRFGGQLAPLAQGSHTAEERLRALVQRANDITPAAQTASERVAAFRGELAAADRTFSQAFVEGLAHFEQVASTAERASEATDSWRDHIRELGTTAAFVASWITSSFNLAFEGIRFGVRTLGGEIAMLAAMAAHPTQAGAIRSAHEAEAGARRADLDAAYRTHAAITQDAFGDRTSAAPGAPQADMVFTAEEVSGAARDAAARDRRTGGGGAGSSDHRTALQRLMDGAIAGASRDATRRSHGSLAYELHGVFGSGEANITIPGEEEALARLRMLTSTATAVDERRRAASTRRPTGGGAPGDLVDQRDAQRAQERSRRILEDQLDAQRSFTDRWEEQHMRRVSVTREASSMIDALYASLGTALSGHFDALVAGRENVKQAAEGIASDVLTAGAKEAYGKAGFYAAEAIGRAVMWDWPGAAMSAAASVAYGLAGAGMSALGAQIAPPPSPSTSAAHGGAASVGRQEHLGPPINARGLGSDTPTVVNHYYAPIFGGRAGTDAEVGRRMNRYTGAESRRQVRDRS